MELLKLMKEKSRGKPFYLLLFLSILFLSISFSNISVYHRLGITNYLISTFSSLLILVFIIYVNVYYSIPQLLRKKRYYQFILTGIGLTLFHFITSSFVSYIIRINSLETPFLKALDK